MSGLELRNNCSGTRIAIIPHINIENVSIVIGTGVAGLAAIGCAKHFGASVRAFDTRLETKEQVESLGTSRVYSCFMTIYLITCVV